jgi:hypothetical protein
MRYNTGQFLRLLKDEKQEKGQEVKKVKEPHHA